MGIISKAKSKIKSAVSSITSAGKKVNNTANVGGAVNQSTAPAFIGPIKNQSFAPVVQTQSKAPPMYTPSTGTGTQDNGFTYTSKGWVPAGSSTPVALPKGSSSSKSSGGSKGTVLGASTASFQGPSINNQTGATTFNRTSTGQVGTNNVSVQNSPLGSAVTQSNLTPTSQITLPEETVTDASMAIPAIAPVDQQIEDEKKKQETSFQDYLDKIVAPPSSADAYNKALKQSGKLQAQQEVNDLTGKLNGIVAQGQANQLSLVGQGRGIPEAIIGGQQAQIGRETAIAALPVQAQLSAAQGNLEMANENLNTLFKIYSEDATNRYNYKTKINEAIYQFADKQSQAKISELQRLQDREYKEKQSNIDTLNAWAKTALANGQKSLFTKFTNLNPSSPTFTQDLAKLQVQIVTAMKTPEAPTIKTINGVDLQWDSRTGQWVTPTGSGSSASGVDKVQQSKDQLSFLRNTAKQAIDLSGAAGPSWISKTLGDTFVGDTEFRQLESLTNTLKTNMLTLATDPNIKKFFGPQMSNADVLLMTSTGTTLNPQANSPTQMKNEIQRLDDLFNRMQTAVGTGQTGGNIITAPNGEQILITD